LLCCDGLASPALDCGGGRGRGGWLALVRVRMCVHFILAIRMADTGMSPEESGGPQCISLGLLSPGANSGIDPVNAQGCIRFSLLTARSEQGHSMTTFPVSSSKKESDASKSSSTVVSSTDLPKQLKEWFFVLGIQCRRKILLRHTDLGFWLYQTALYPLTVHASRTS
jgi:hypothetical protein